MARRGKIVGVASTKAVREEIDTRNVGGRDKLGLLSTTRPLRPALHVTSPIEVISVIAVKSKGRPDRPQPSPPFLPTTTTTMSSLRHHRVIIASLFLPNTAVLGDSAPSSPDEPAGIQTPGFARGPLLQRTSGPLKSIVEDLKDKVRSRSYGTSDHIPGRAPSVQRSPEVRRKVSAGLCSDLDMPLEGAGCFLDDPEVA